VVDFFLKYFVLIASMVYSYQERLNAIKSERKNVVSSLPVFSHLRYDIIPAVRFLSICVFVILFHFS